MAGMPIEKDMEAVVYKALLGILRGCGRSRCGQARYALRAPVAAGFVG